MSWTPAPSADLREVKAQFLATLNHEMRTPLTGILGMLDLLRETGLTEEQREYADSSYLCAENLLDIMNATLEFSALAANQVTLEDSEFSLPEMLESMVEDCAPKARAKQLSLYASLEPDLPRVVIGDALRLKQLLSKLVENAVKFTNRGEVQVSGSAMPLLDGNALVRVSVRDTGIGIPTEKLTHIFESFQQLDSGLARKYSGLGLGLAVTQQLATLMHAELSVSSALGKGSTFTVHVPLRLPGDAAGVPRHRFLLAGGELRAPEHLMQRLASHSIEIQPFVGIPSALQAARGLRYDLILLDIEGAGTAYPEVLARFRAMPGYTDVPVVALVDGCAFEKFHYCLEQGMQAVIDKPIQPDDLLVIAEKHLYGPARARSDHWPRFDSFPELSPQPIN